MLSTEGCGYILSDLRSRKGTFLNGTRPVTLRDGDEIRFGDTTVRYRCTRRREPSPVVADFAATQRLDHVRECPCWLLLADVVGFTTQNEQFGRESAFRRMQAWITAVRPLIEQHAGHINGYLGDALFAYWLADAVPPAPSTCGVAGATRSAWLFFVLQFGTRASLSSAPHVRAKSSQTCTRLTSAFALPWCRGRSAASRTGLGGRVLRDQNRPFTPAVTVTKLIVVRRMRSL